MPGNEELTYASATGVNVIEPEEAVGVAACVGVAVGADVGVKPMTAVGVAVGTGVRVKVGEAVGACVSVGVVETTGVGLCVSVDETAGVGVRVAVGDGVAVGVGNPALLWQLAVPESLKVPPLSGRNFQL